MTPEELRSIMVYLTQRVALGPREAERAFVITFQTPTEGEMLAAGLHAEGVRRMLRAPWWSEMVADIVETPDVCDPGDSPERVLEYARDVVTEYIRKRFPLEGE